MGHSGPFYALRSHVRTPYRRAEPKRESPAAGLTSPRTVSLFPGVHLLQVGTMEEVLVHRPAREGPYGAARTKWLAKSTPRSASWSGVVVLTT